METIFWICVKIMQVASTALGISYQQLNVLLFVLLHPAISVYLFIQDRRYKRRWQACVARNDDPTTAVLGDGSA